MLARVSLLQNERSNDSKWAAEAGFGETLAVSSQLVNPTKVVNCASLAPHSDCNDPRTFSLVLRRSPVAELNVLGLTARMNAAFFLFWYRLEIIAHVCVFYWINRIRA